MKIAVFCSGYGSNFQAIVNARKKGLFKADIALMVCDNPHAYAIKRAKKEKIKTLVIKRSDFSSKKEFEENILRQLEKERIGLVCLAGYMRILSTDFIRRYKNRILNIHPALLPSFSGTEGIKDAMDYGAKVTGVTVHFVNEDVDAGPIILQEAVRIRQNDTEATLAKRIHNIEHKLYPEAIRLFTEKKLKITKRKVKILTAAVSLLLVFGFESNAMLGREIAAVPVQKTEFLPRQGLFSKAELFLKVELPLLTEQNLKPQAEDKKPATKNRYAKMSRAYKKLGIMAYPLYANREAAGGLTDAELLNSKISITKPLSKEDIDNMRIEGSFKIAKSIADAADSMGMGIAYDGINGLIDTAKRIIELRNYIHRKYNLYLRADADKAIIRYKKRF